MPTDNDSRILVDTSAWIHFLRPEGERSVARRVQAALRNGSACWCQMVRLELWNGAGGSREQKVLRDFERDLPELIIDEAVWNEAYAIARACRGAGITVPNTDILIAACAKRHGASLEHADQDFDHIASALDRAAP
ncbi:MAG: PIN domain-containing protein [Wenzhouxiangella sp.]|nr:PIN domain-containing protein [Wenzhouxiangella sp.]MCH8479372.1 PIN domain-containing protein [Wenzhouxiangella sp.]